MIRYYIFFEAGPVYGFRTVDISEGDLLAGFDPIDVMWHELYMDVGNALDGLEKAARVARTEILEEVQWI